ncbi:MAG: anhydro-N-acetylmuramic acid kinase [Alphaproteobacteria bacterium]|nr:anhydro-N-acetylmuramic acid kinase [Alphaproteobacteria bacterium]
MEKDRYIGIMTGNSDDAIDAVLTEIGGNGMTDIYFFSVPFSRGMQKKMEYLRRKVHGKTREEIMNVSKFIEIHDEYVRQVADAINKMCKKFNIDKSKVSAIGFHGKTLDHNPPSKDKVSPYTLQIGSGQMLADLTGIPVSYDFRSAFIKAGLDAAPLVPLHNAHIAIKEGGACFYNGGNTSNFAWVVKNKDKNATEPYKALSAADAGPFNEFIDNYIRSNTQDSCDLDGKYGKKGNLNKELLQKCFDIGRDYYERGLPKSGDPQYYYRDKVFDAIKKLKVPFNDAVYTLEYFAAYIAVQGVTLTPKDVVLPSQFLLFGGGWKNPVVLKSFEDLLAGKGYVLPEHEIQFKKFLNRFNKVPTVKYSKYGKAMEARLFADLARYTIKGKPWITPESEQAGKEIFCGRFAKPNKGRKEYTDYINEACCGWQAEEKQKNLLRIKEVKGKIR